MRQLQIVILQSALEAAFINAPHAVISHYVHCVGGEGEGGHRKLLFRLLTLLGSLFMQASSTAIVYETLSSQ